MISRRQPSQSTADHEHSGTDRNPLRNHRLQGLDAGRGAPQQLAGLASRLLGPVSVWPGAKLTQTDEFQQIGVVVGATKESLE